MGAQRLSGPPSKGRKDRTSNPSLPTSMDDLGSLAELFPTLAVWMAGGVIGVVEALAKGGMLPVWAGLASHWKAVIFALGGSGAGWMVGELKAERASTRGREALEALEVEIERYIEARGLCWGLALIHGVEAGASLLPIDGFNRLGKGGVFITEDEAKAAKMQGILQGFGDVDQLIQSDIGPAIDELLRNRERIEEASRADVGEIAFTPSEAMNVGELSFNFQRG